jgi:hypothetical protein
LVVVAHRRPDRDQEDDVVPPQSLPLRLDVVLHALRVDLMDQCVPLFTSKIEKSWGTIFIPMNGVLVALEVWYSGIISVCGDDERSNPDRVKGGS